MFKAYRMMKEASEVTQAFVDAGMPPPSAGGRKTGITQRVSNLKETKKWLHLLSKNNKNFTLWPSGLKSVSFEFSLLFSLILLYSQ